MKKFLIPFFLLVLVLFGCEAPQEEIIKVDVVPMGRVQSNSTIDSSSGPELKSSITATLNDVPSIDQTWISPGKVSIGNYYSGARAEWFIQIHNGKSTPVNFTVSYREPSYTSFGYSKPPPTAISWVTVSDPSPVLGPYETRSIPVVLSMPGVSKVSGLKKWEFWISVVDSSQKGSVRTELCSRWLVVMR